MSETAHAAFARLRGQLDQAIVGPAPNARRRRPAALHTNKNMQEGAGSQCRTYLLHTLCVMASLRLKNYFQGKVNREGRDYTRMSVLTAECTKSAESIPVFLQNRLFDSRD